MTTFPDTLDPRPRRRLDEAIRRASRMLERHEREVVELETRLAMTRRTLTLTGYLVGSLSQLATPTTPTTPPARIPWRRLRVAFG